MSDLSEKLLLMNQAIHNAVAAAEFQKARDLDAARYTFIATLPASAFNDTVLQAALNAALNDLQAMTQQIQTDLQGINRLRRIAAKAHHTYRETAKYQKAAR